MQIENQKVSITTEFIKLDSLLKFSGIATTGAEAKAMIQDGIVDVNDECCLMRGKKIRVGDKVSVNADDVVIILEVE